ncbi:CoA-binding protein [Trichlorobacter ammonificans]|nr:CoA-binding protein [Trichlorobacter ammonificans]
MTPEIDRFFQAEAFGVVGASEDRGKFGNKVLRCYLENRKTVIPVNPKAVSIEGIPCVASVAELPDTVKSISVITPPPVTEQVVEAAIARGITSVWMQPGAESPAAVERCRAAGVNVIADHSCILVVLGFRDH